jgi:hypothetical protein
VIFGSLDPFNGSYLSEPRGSGGERKAAGDVIRLGPLSHWVGNREAALSPTGLGIERRTMQQRLHWLEYDSVALAVLVIGMGVVELLAVLM